MELRGATVVVTGGGAGIGEALVRRFAADGARVVLGDLDGDAATRVAEEVGGVAVACDGVGRWTADARDRRAVRRDQARRSGVRGVAVGRLRRPGITVQALCPQGVRTDILMSDDSPGGRLLLPEALEPAEVVHAVARALGTGAFLILPHPEVAGYEVNRATDRDRWLSAMRRIRASATPEA